MRTGLGFLRDALAGAIGQALKTFTKTLLGFLSAGMVLAYLSASVLQDHPEQFRALAATLAVLESVAAGFILGSRWAVASAVTQAMQTFRLRQPLVTRLFDRMLGDARTRELGGQIAQGLGRIPAAQAGELLRNAFREIRGGEIRQGGWLWRKVQGRLLETTKTYTMKRFREEGAAQGSVDLEQVRGELERNLEGVLVQKVQVGLRLLTLAVFIGLPLVVALQTWILLLLLQAQS